jgi:hypothetical protein
MRLIVHDRTSWSWLQCRWVVACTEFEEEEIPPENEHILCTNMNVLCNLIVEY